MLSENIRAMRKSKGLSQQELAMKLNVVRQTISKWELEAILPEVEKLVLLCELLDAKGKYGL